MATYTLISSNVLASSAATVTFSAIPATYTDLVLRISARGANASTLRQIYLILNNDTGTNYSRTWVRGDGSGADSTRSQDAQDLNIVQADAANATADTFSSHEVYIPNYLSTSSKPLSAFSAQENNTTQAYLGAVAGLYRNSTAITSIEINLQTVNFVSGSSFYLYGISNA